MNVRSRSIILLCVVLAMLVWGCASIPKDTSTIYSAGQISDILAAGGDFPEQGPIAPREFHPYLAGKWIGQAVSYGCYRPGQAPGVKGPSKAEILEDLLIISQHWNLIRVYNADDDTQRILEVITENNLPVRMLLGIWLENESGRPEIRASNIGNVMRGIELANRYGNCVIAINVGNETQVYWSWHRMQDKDLLRYIRAVRSATTIPVTTADDYNFWNKPESRSIAAELDFITVHAYPLWNGQNLKTAFPWLDSTLAAVQEIHPDKTMVLGEIGWATDYDASKTGDGQQGTLIKGEVGLDGQQAFLIELHQWVQARMISTFLFEAFDEPWKGGGEST